MLRQKRSFVLMLLIILLGFFTGSTESKVLAAEGTNSEIITVTEDIINDSKEVTEGSGGTLYNGSTIDATTVNEFKSAIASAISKCDSGITINYKGTTSVGTQSTFLSNAVKEAMQSEGNDYEKTLLCKWSYSYTQTSPQFTVDYTFTYLETPQQRADVDSKVDEILASIITPSMTEEQKEKAINDYILLNIAYDTTLKDHTAYGGLFGDRKTVCQGYALLAYKMLKKAGFEARIITGVAGGPHAWNMVKVGGNWYHLDCTWNDPLPDVIGRVTYSYFNVTDNQLSARTWDKTKYPVATVAYNPTDSAIKAGFENYYSKVPSKVTIKNNFKVADTVVTSDLVAGDVVKVYSAITGGKILGSATVAAGKTEASATISQLTIAAGKVYVSVKSANRMESNRVEVSYDAEPTTNAIVAGVVTITNNYGITDTVKVTGLTTGYIVKVYKDATITTPLGTATVANGLTEATVKIAQIGENIGNVYVTVTEYGKNESARTAVSFIAEVTTVKPSADNITVTNNITGLKDTVKVTGLATGDVVKVYGLETAVTSLGTATVLANKTEAIVSVSQVGVQAGSVYVTVANVGKKESAKVGKAFVAESQTTALGATVITATNNYKIADTVKVTGLTTGNIVKVYKDASAVKPIGSSTVARGKTEAIVSIPQISEVAGKVYVSLTIAGNNESARTEVSYEEEKTTIKPAADNITVTNNITGRKDTIRVTGLVAGDVVKVYDLDTAIKPLGSVTVAAGKTEAIVSISQIGVKAGSVYVTISNIGKKESAKVAKAFVEEPQTVALGASVITITNNFKIADTVKVTGLVTGNVVKVYKDATATKPIGSATVPKEKTEAVVSISQISEVAGKVYVSLTVADKNESARIDASYEEEKTTVKPSADNITVTNNITGRKDTIKLTGLVSGDVVKVYGLDTAIKPIGSATVLKDKTEAIVSVSQIGVKAGSVYVTISNIGKKESEKVAKAFAQEPQTTELGATVITVTNNYKIADTVKVTGLVTGNVVKVYKDATATKPIGSATVPKEKTEAVVSISQISEVAGKVYVSLTVADKNESIRTEASYEEEKTTEKPSVDNVSVTNNITGKKDTVKVTGLVVGAVVKVYDVAGKALGTATVPVGKTETIVSVAQVGVKAGSISVTVSNVGKKESAKVAISFIEEVQTTALGASTISVTNNSKIADTVKVTGLTAGAIVKVYKDKVSVTPIGKAVVAAGKTEAIVSISQFGAVAGNTYVTVTVVDKNESARTEVSYQEEKTTDKPSADSIAVTNNITGKADAVKVSGLTTGDVVKVYDLDTAGRMLGTATVLAGKTEAIATVAQVGAKGGSIYVAVTNVGKNESARVVKAFDAEPQSTNPAVNTITITNNITGKVDTIKITGLTAGSIVKVYRDATTVTPLGKATVVSGATEATISITQLGAAGGKLYIAVTEVGKNESIRTEVTFAKE